MPPLPRQQLVLRHSSRHLAASAAGLALLPVHKSSPAEAASELSRKCAFGILGGPELPIQANRLTTAPPSEQATKAKD